MEQYNAERAAQSNDKLEQLKKLLESNPKMKKTELAKKLDISLKVELVFNFIRVFSDSSFDLVGTLSPSAADFIDS